MPLIQLTDEPEGFLTVVSIGTAEVTLSFRTGLGILRATGIADPTLSITGEVPMELYSLGIGNIGNSFIRVNDEANIFIEADSQGVAEATMNLTKAVDLSCIARGTSSAELSTLVQANTESEVIRFIIDILPAVNVSRYRQYKVRCSLNGSNLPIASFTLTKSSVSSSFSAKLARLSDKSLIVSTGSFKFEIGEVILGTTTWRTVLDSAVLSSKSYSIGMSDDSPTDTFSFVTSSNLASKLLKTPIRNTVYYDPTRTTVESTAIEVFRDTAGGTYTSQVIGISGMTLYDLFQEVFVTRCGFTSYVTNLPDFPIKRADFPFQRSYYESLRGLIGMFDLAITANEDNTIIYIRDTTTGVPSGFPAPRTLTTTDYKTFQRNDQESNIQALRLNYISNDTELTFRVQRLVQTTTDLGGGLTEEVDNTVFDIYSVAFPTTVIRTIPDLLEKRIYEGSVQLSNYTERYTYNSENRPTLITKTQEAKLPTAGSGGVIEEALGLTMQRYSDETTRIEYSSHPFIPQAVFQKQIVTRSTGLVVRDDETSYLGEPFLQSLYDAHKAGNVLEGMAVVSQNVETIIETFSPQPNGQIKVDVRTVSHARSNLVNTHSSEERAGDAALNNAGQSTQRLLVLEIDGDTLTGSGVEDFHIGELPLYIGIPLARRKLVKLKTYLGSASAELLGLDLDIFDGTTVALESRESESQGMIIAGSTRISGTGLGTENQQISQTVEGERISV